MCGSSLLFGPEFVMFPDSAWLCPKVALDFWDNQRQMIHEVTNNHVFYGLTHHLGEGYLYSKYMTAVECHHTNRIPEGMMADSFGGYPCVKFHYIGRHHYREISQETAHDMYAAIGRYCNTEDPPAEIHLEKIDMDEFDGEYCLFEFYMPLKKHISMPGLARHPYVK